MANILDRYGIKEVADMTFYEIGDDGNPTRPVLFLDTLKVSTIEQTGEEAEARGGKGNPPLIIWDYGKEITVTLEDALFSAKSMAIMFGNGSVKSYTGDNAFIMKTEQFTSGTMVESAIPREATNITSATVVSGWNQAFTAPDGRRYKKFNPKFYDASGKRVEATASDGAVQWTVGEKYFCSYDLKVEGSIIEISANSFPGTYYAVGDTYARSEVTGKDEFFQFIIPKAKVQSENTITLEAEGDPSVFNMSLRVMRPANGQMMKLVKYNLFEDATISSDAVAEEVEFIHNHYLDKNNVDELDQG